jgi:hypothetical protein
MHTGGKVSIDWLIQQIEERKLTIIWKWNGKTSCISSIKVPPFVREEAMKMYQEEIKKSQI